MGKFRGLDTDEGWMRRALADLQRQISELAAARRLESSTISTGGITVKDGGAISAIGPIASASISGGVIYLSTMSGGLSVVPRMSLFPNRLSFDTGVGPLAIVGSSSPGQGFLTGTEWRISHPTTSSPANAVLDPVTNVLARSTSSERYKQDIEDATVDPAAVLKMQGRTWRDKAEVVEEPDTEKRYVGFIAEELDELGLTDFVEYDEDGQPEAIAYDRLSVALMAVLKDQERRLRRVEGIVAR